jgi:HSP20 family molecular chaperone IbpA
MFTEEGEEQIDKDEMEKWLENFFLDPLTSHFDQTQFQIELSETDHDWIIEAFFTDNLPSEIVVCVQGRKIIITAVQPNQQKRVRMIEFPFMVTNHKITDSFSNGILEIFISKKVEVIKSISS